MKTPQFIIETQLLTHQLKFKTTYGMFSYKEIDQGTKLLINSIDVTSAKTILDLGCGYGPIGICLAKENPSADVYLVDRDFIAVEYAEKKLQIK